MSTMAWPVSDIFRLFCTYLMVELRYFTGTITFIASQTYKDPLEIEMDRNAH